MTKQTTALRVSTAKPVNYSIGATKDANSHGRFSPYSRSKTGNDHRSVSELATMKYLLSPLVLPCFATAICLRFLSKKDTEIIINKPGHIWFWNANMNEFDKLETLTMNDTAFCSINTINPFIMQNADKTGVTGFIGDIWTNLEDLLGFKTIYRSPRLKYYRMNENTHALLTASMMHLPSTSYYDYSLPFTTNSYALFVHWEGEKVSTTWYLDTFSSDLWLTAFIFILCIACSIMGMYRIKKLIHTNYMEFHDELSSPLFCLLYVLGGISGQGFQKVPRSWSFRLIILSCLTFGLLLSCGFSSTLTSDLANMRDSFPFTSLEDVATKRTHILCIRNGSNAYSYFTVDESSDGEIKDNWKDLINHGCPDMSNDNLTPELCDPSFVYLEAPSRFRSIYYRVQRNCSFIQLPETYWSRRMVFLHSRSAQHRHLINMYILRMGTAGILNYLEKKWMLMNTYGESNYLGQSTFQPVEYEHISLAFCGFFMMVIVSVFICVLENVWYKLRLRYKRINSTLVLVGPHDYISVNMTKVYRKPRPRVVIVRRCQTVRSILLPEIMKDPVFLQNVTVRVSRR
ncbi:uncharacterized protein LOC116840316 isoform X2 [Odontomachus brunneus]|uniref:uncharacterized protein LOC116840316 isoform X2 n=1 Tax=Odontomachus brunneus TaxID=486640 RepID=UPI0013F21877|nr:uncharacterized protein LOC116840316 isoform X2 [Odontomachus brunneus]